MNEILSIVVLFIGNFMLGFIPYGLVTPALNKEMRDFADNLVFARELLIKLPFAVECKILRLAIASMQTERLISLVGIFPESAAADTKTLSKKIYRGTF